MKNEVIKQDEIIKEIYSFLKEKNRDTPLVKSALCTLDNMNEMQKYYVESLTNTHEVGERILRLYALLQGLFVCIDSLYALAYDMCGSKSFININQNKMLKELKYIRNDVVGHPVNRVYEDNTVAYCLLNPKDIHETTILYYIYTNNTHKTKSVDLVECLNNYYLESNDLLKYLFDFYKHNVKENSIVLITKKFYDSFDPEKYDESGLRKNYEENYKNKNEKQSRYIWRLNILSRYKENKHKGFKRDLYNYALSNQVKKLMEIAYLLENQKIEVDIKCRFPRYLILFKEFLYTNKSFIKDLDILVDATHPYFMSTLENIRNILLKSNNKVLLELIDWLIENKEDEGFVYLVGSTFKTIKVF
ncbi:MAG: hypothetical protein R3Y60_03465 [bacterium]